MPVSPTPESPREVPRKRKLRRRRFNDDPRWIMQCLLWTLKPLSNLSRSIPLQYVTAFLMVALDEGRGVGTYARALGMHRWTMSRYLNAIGPRGRNGGPGLDLVIIKHDPYDPRWTEVFLTPKGRAVADDVFKQMRRVKRNAPPGVFERSGTPLFSPIMNGAKPRKRVTRGTMTTAEYLAALERVGLPRTGGSTSDALGVTTRQLTRYANGHPIPKTVEKILTLMLMRWQEYGAAES